MSVEQGMASAPMDARAVKLYSPLALAYLGDSVYELMVRDRILRAANRPARQLHDSTVAHVRAEYQAEAVKRIAPMLTEEEAEMLRRGRNASGISVPRHSTTEAYRKATGLECLFGFLHLCGRTERMAVLFAAIWTDETDGSDAEQKASEPSTMRQADAVLRQSISET